MIARIVIVLAIVGIIIGALILGQGGPTSVVQPESVTSQDMPGYSARDAEVIQTGDDGRPQFVVLSPLIRQHANDDRVQLDAPRLTFVSAENGTWHAQSLSGLIRGDGSKVDLYGEVKMEGELSGSPVVLNTSTMTFDTQTEIARTPAYVSVEARGGTLTATGLVANLKEGTLELESNPHLESRAHGRSSSK